MKALATIALLIPGIGHAQLPTSSLDTTVIRIGEQVTLTLGLGWPADRPAPLVEWPTLGDSLSRHIEVVERSEIDTVRYVTVDGTAVLRVKFSVQLTSFDTGFWALAPFRFHIDGQPAETAPLLLEVRPTIVDESGELRPIRDIYEAPFSLWWTLRSAAPWLAGGVLVLAMAWLLWWVMRRRKTALPIPEPPAAQLPLHERVVAALRALEAQRLWQQDLHKAYHAGVTDLLRGYIEERYGVPALERTTDELLLQLKLSALGNEQRQRLANMLRLADLVKFAKARPSSLENEQMMTEALRLVQETAEHRTATSPKTQQGATPPALPNPGQHAR